MPVRFITLTTDFGEGSPYVAQMKAAAFSVNPDVILVDMTHSINPQDIRHGAVVLADVTDQFPPGTIHVAVVDPGVGTQRGIVYARMGTQQFVAPDNGLLSLVAHHQPVSELVAVRSSKYWRHPVSATFHGRDIMAPVAAHLSLGVQPRELGTAQNRLEPLDWPPIEREPFALTGAVVLIDHFGNLITNITRAMLPPRTPLDQVRVQYGQRASVGMVQTYAQAPPATAVALFGSTDRLEMAVPNGNAAHTLALDVGHCVRVTWAEKQT